MPNRREIAPLIAMALPPVLLAIVIARTAVNVPFWDEWAFLPKVQRWMDGTWAWSDLVSQHNEHFIVFPTWIFLLLASATHWDVRAPMAASWLISIGTFGLLARAWRAAGADRLSTTAKSMLALLGSVHFFTLAQCENWVWGWQLTIFLACLAATAGLCTLAFIEDERLTAVASIACGFVTTFSFASGILYWVAAAPILWQRAKRTQIAFAIGGALAVTLFVYSLAPVERHDASLWRMASDPIAALKYVCGYLGGPFRPAPRVTGIMGALGVAAAASMIFALRRAGGSDRIVALGESLVAFGFGSAAITAYGRLSLSWYQAFTPRYATIAILFWAGLGVLALRCLQLRTSGVPTRPLLAILAVVILLGVPAWTDGLRACEEERRVRMTAREALLRGDLDDPAVARIHPFPEKIAPALETARRLGLSFYRR